MVLQYLVRDYFYFSQINTMSTKNQSPNEFPVKIHTDRENYASNVTEPVAWPLC